MTITTDQSQERTVYTIEDDGIGIRVVADPHPMLPKLQLYKGLSRYDPRHDINDVEDIWGVISAHRAVCDHDIADIMQRFIELMEAL